MPNLPDVVAWSIPAFVLLTVIEMISVRIHPDESAAGYETKDAATSVGMGLGSLAFDFGSFVAETERPVYGLTKNIDTFNPVKVATHEYVAIVKDIKAAGSWRERAGRVFRGPGRQPASARRERPAEETVVA